MRVGYCVPFTPELASFRLRVALPALHLSCPYRIGASGDVNFFFKDGAPELASRLKHVVYDVVNDHFDRPSYRDMCALATAITVSSPVMADIVRRETGRTSTVIDDPYENDQQPVKCIGQNVLWFGHSLNLPSLPDLDGFDLTICTNTRGSVFWSLDSERWCLDHCAVVVLTGTNPGASSNRVVKALRAGRPVVIPPGIEAWEQFAPYVWMGEIREGLNWTLNNREEACRRTQAGQQYIAERFHPRTIGRQWRDVFNSTSAAGTNVTQAGSASISRTDSAISPT